MDRNGLRSDEEEGGKSPAPCQNILNSQAQHEPTQPVDPNTLWPNPYDKQATTILEDMGDDFDKEEQNTDMVTVLKNLFATICKVWSRHSHAFRDFWDRMRPSSRENFLRVAYPTLYHSLEDRYSVHNHVKVYVPQYERYVLLSPFMTIENLIKDNNLPDLIAEWTTEYAFKLNSSEMAVTMRSLCGEGVYPLSKEEFREYSEQLRMKKGCIMNFNQTEFGQFMQIKKPQTLLHGTGSTMGPDGRPVNLYRMGVFLHLFEWQHVSENYYFILTMIGNCLEEFEEEIVGKKYQKANIVLKACLKCAKCGKAEGLKMCAKCNTSHYCSKVCYIIIITIFF